MARITFTFDDRSLSTLEDLKAKGRFSSMGEAVRDSLQLNSTVHSQELQGFTEVILRNPITREERIVVRPSAAPAKAKIA